MDLDDFPIPTSQRSARTAVIAYTAAFTSGMPFQVRWVAVGAVGGVVVGWGGVWLGWAGVRSGGGHTAFMPACPLAGLPACLPACPVPL